MKLKSTSINGIPPEVIELLKDAHRRDQRDTGYPVSFQAFLRKLLQDAADRESALQDAAGAEYAAQQSDSNRGKV